MIQYKQKINSSEIITSLVKVSFAEDDISSFERSDFNSNSSNFSAINFFEVLSPEELLKFSLTELVREDDFGGLREFRYSLILSISSRSMSNWLFSALFSKSTLGGKL